MPPKKSQDKTYGSSSSSRPKPKIEQPSNMLPENRDIPGGQPPYASGGQAPYASGGQAPYPYGGQAPYPYGGQVPYPVGGQVPYPVGAQAPPFSYGAANTNPFSAGSTSQGRSLAIAHDDPNKTKWHDLRCEDCNKLIGQVPIIGDSHLIREPVASARSGRLQKTVWKDSKTKEVVAAVKPDQRGRCEWHGGELER